MSHVTMCSHVSVCVCVCGEKILALFLYLAAILKGLNLFLHQCDNPADLKEDAHADLRLGLLSQTNKQTNK